MFSSKFLCLLQHLAGVPGMQNTWVLMDMLEQLLQSWGVPTPSAGALVNLVACFLTMERNGLWRAPASELEPLLLLCVDCSAVAKFLNLR